MAANSNQFPAHIGTFAESIIPMVLEMILQGQSHIEATPSHQAMRIAALDPAKLSDAIEKVTPAALQIVLEGLKAVVGLEFAPNDEDIKYFKDHISVWYQRNILLRQMAANAT